MLLVEPGAASAGAGLPAASAGPFPVRRLLFEVLIFEARWAAASSARPALSGLRAVLLRDSKKLLLPDESPVDVPGVAAAPGARPLPLLTMGLVVRALLLRNSFCVFCSLLGLPRLEVLPVAASASV